MLILARKVGESIVINGDIVVTIVKIERGSIKVGIDAPYDVTVARTELLESETLRTVLRSE